MIPHFSAKKKNKWSTFTPLYSLCWYEITLTILVDQSYVSMNFYPYVPGFSVYLLRDLHAQWKQFRILTHSATKTAFLIQKFVPRNLGPSLYRYKKVFILIFETRHSSFYAPIAKKKRSTFTPPLLTDARLSTKKGCSVNTVTKSLVVASEQPLKNVKSGRNFTISKMPVRKTRWARVWGARVVILHKGQINGIEKDDLQGFFDSEQTKTVRAATKMPERPWLLPYPQKVSGRPL